MNVDRYVSAKVVEDHEVKLWSWMVKPIGGGIVASFHLGMSGLSARLTVCV
jgi:hypothetical protein